MSWVPQWLLGIYYQLDTKWTPKQVVKQSPERSTYTIAPDAKEGPEKKARDHQLWCRLLRKHVTSAKIQGRDTLVMDYEKLAKDKKFPTYLKQLEEADPSSWSPNRQLAFWINAYNALAMKTVIEAKKQVDGLTKIHQWNRGGISVWDQKAGKVAGKEYSLNEIEHGIIRKDWNDPAVLVCLNFASVGSGDLLQKAFEGRTLRFQVDEAMSHYLTNKTKGLEIRGKTARLSRIFLWYAEDFSREGKQQGILDYVAQYARDADKESLKGCDSIEYFRYEWQLNAKADDGLVNLLRVV
eukprot:gb/GEZN01009080.1/.p1 GENE.gb/GEZN01009080.1/~~gb/GEZN01009080.1/.p1  ORF type:complete len:305 (-),score=43.64 gb/GEZN01009080.1/:446-1333(-)